MYAIPAGLQVHFGGHRRFTVEAPGASLVGKYVESASLDGQPLERAWFGNDALHPGGVLHLSMSPVANTGQDRGEVASKPRACWATRILRH